MDLAKVAYKARNWVTASAFPGSLTALAEAPPLAENLPAAGTLQMVGCFESPVPENLHVETLDPCHLCCQP